MSTMSILTICGFAYLMFVTWLFRRKGDNKTGNPSPQSGSADPQKHEVGLLVPKSTFDMDDFRKALTASMTAAITYALNAKIGDVSPDDVEFHEAAEGSIGEAIPTIDDVEKDSVSPPATGDSIEEIEAALNIAARSGSTANEKAQAGRILSGMGNMVFIGKIMASDEKINEGIMACIAESYRRKPRPAKKGSPTPKKKSKPIDMGGTFRDPDMIKRKKDDDEED